MRRYLPLICILLVSSRVLPAEYEKTIYKWIDDAGETHYTQFPPQNRDYQIIHKAAPPDDNPQKIRENLQQQVQDMDKTQQERADKKMDAEQWHEIQKLRRENCATARQNLANLHQGGQKAFMTPDGQVVRLTDEERQRRIDEANKQIKENCN